MDGLSKPCITRLSRRAGIKTLSEDCHDTIRNLVGIKLNEIIKTIMVINESNNTKSIMSSDVYKALNFLGHNITESNYLNIVKKNIS